MSSFAEIYDFEGQLETAIQAALVASPFELVVKVPNDTIDFQKERPRVELLVNEGGADDSRRIFTYDNAKRHDLYNATITLQLYTATRNDGHPHAQYRAKVRSAMALIFQTQINAALTNLEVRRIVPTGATPTIKPEEGYEESAMTFAIVFGVKTSAWPADEAEAYPT